MSEARDKLIEQLITQQSQLLDKIERLEEKANAPAPKGVEWLPTDTFGEAWAQWDRDVLRPTGKTIARKDGPRIAMLAPVILDLPFTYKKQEMTLRGVPLNELTPMIYEAWKERLKITPKSWLAERNQIANADKLRGNQPYRRGTVNRFSNVGKACVSWKCGGKNLSPLKGITRESVTAEARSGFFASWEEFIKFLLHCNQTLRDMLLLATTSGGMRRIEVRLLQIHEVDWEKRSILLEPNRNKNKHKRKFPIEDDPAFYDVFAMLCRRKKAAEEIGTTYLFFNPAPRAPKRGQLPVRGLPVPDKTMGNWMSETARRSGTKLDGEWATFHHARHTWGTWAAQDGVSLLDIMREGGWRDPKVALGYIKEAQGAGDRTREIRRRARAERANADKEEAA